MDKEQLIKDFSHSRENKIIFTITAVDQLVEAEDGSGMELNAGYNYDVNSSIPEIADAIAKLALQLPQQGFGEGSDTLFIKLINEYFNELSKQD